MDVRRSPQCRRCLLCCICSSRWLRQTGRDVHNIIRAELTVVDGKIVTHVDHFDLYRWMKMAMGPQGVLLGWLPPVQKALQKKARAGLVDFMSQGK